MNGDSAMSIVHAAPQAADIDPVPNIELADGLHSNHFRWSPNLIDDSSSDGDVLRPCYALTIPFFISFSSPFF